MAGDKDWDPEKDWHPRKMLDAYIHDYLVKKNCPETASIFAKDVDVDPGEEVAIDIPEGFLTEWWSMFWDMYRTRAQANNRDLAESSSTAQRTMGNEVQNIDPQEMKRQRIEQSPDITAALGHPAAFSFQPMDLRSQYQLLLNKNHAQIMPYASNTRANQQMQVHNMPQQMQVHNWPQQQNARVDRPISGSSLPAPMNSTPGDMSWLGWPFADDISTRRGHQITDQMEYLQQLQYNQKYLSNLKLPINVLPDVDVQMMNNPMPQTAENEVVILSENSTPQQDSDILKLQAEIEEELIKAGLSQMMPPPTQTVNKQG